MDEQVSMPPVPTEMGYPTLRDEVALEAVSMLPVHAATRTPTLRDALTVIFRHHRLILASFVAVFAGVVLGTCMLPKQYESRMKILVKRERADPVVSADASSQSVVMRDVTQEDLNSEVELIRSHDLLEKVVVSCGLHTLMRDSHLDRILGRKKTSDADPRIPRAVSALEKNLKVEPIQKSKMIEVSYEAQDPKLAANVLQTLSGLYLDKHLAVHRAPGALDFFQQQTDQYQKGLEKAERQLAQFKKKEDFVSLEIERDITLRKLSEFEAQLRETQVAQAAAEQRIKSLETLAAATPQRVVTQMRDSDNSMLLQQLKSTLLNLELKRTELLSKYEPGYREVQEVDTQIAQAREALAQAEKKPLHDETTDLDKTRQWLDEELSRQRAEAATLEARATEIAKVLEKYRESARKIARREFEQSDLIRATRPAEENYLLYLRKQEEARISDALDRKRIVNVAIAEAATEPAMPSSPNWYLNLVVGLFLAFLTSFGLAFVVDHMDPSFRTPDEVESYLGVPVIASLPRS